MGCYAIPLGPTECQWIMDIKIQPSTCSAFGVGRAGDTVFTFADEAFVLTEQFGVLILPPEHRFTAHVQPISVIDALTLA